MMPRPFVDAWRREKSAAFKLLENSSARRTIPLELWGTPLNVYANANLSIYSGQACNARCGFCVEELRPASRGVPLTFERHVESNDERYFAALAATLDALKPLDPSVSITGGEPTKDPRLPRLLATLASHHARKRTLTTNGSGLLDVREGRAIIDWVTETGVRHLNVSRAHPDASRNADIMQLHDGLDDRELARVVRRATEGGTRPRLSSVLIRGAIDSLDGVLEYLAFAKSVDVDNVIFRQLMKTDPKTVTKNAVVHFSDQKRVPLEPILDRVSADSRFQFVKQIIGYYYYVEVWRSGGIDVVFEEADLAHLERAKRATPPVVHELVFHPSATLASTWQPWDGVFGPPGLNAAR